MKPRIVNEAQFRIIGSSVRTSNAQEMAGAGHIARLWKRFVAENLLAQIPDKLDGAILAVYTDYANDQDGEYTLIVGARVKGEAKPPQGMVVKNVPVGRYAMFTSGKGPVEKIVFETWQRIWSTARPEMGGDRAYVADFEVYDQRAANPRDAQVDVYVGIR
jgi:predicted transcriptional regulator YdeE